MVLNFTNGYSVVLTPLVKENAVPPFKYFSSLVK